VAEPTRDQDLARIAHLAVRIEELTRLTNEVYLPAANRLWAAAHPAGRRLVEELTLSIGASGTSPMAGSLAALAQVVDAALTGFEP
jgi:hypothetical protein